MLQEFHGSRFLSLNLDIVECISSFPELLSGQPSPFRNLISLNIDSGTRDTCKVKMSTEARNFLLENCPNATFIMKELPTEAMKEAKLVADIENHMKEVEASLEQNNIVIETNEAIDKKKVVIENLVDDIQVWTNKKMVQNEYESGQILDRLIAQLWENVGEFIDMVSQANQGLTSLILKKVQVGCLLNRLPKRQRKQIEARYSRQHEQIQALIDRQDSITNFIRKNLDAFKKKDRFLVSEDVSSSKHPLPSQTSSSSSTIVPTPSTSIINPMP